MSDRQKWGSGGSSELKIAMLSIHSCPLGKVGGENTGGMSVYIRELARELGRRGHLVDVYTRIHEPIHDQVVELGENARLIHLKAGEEETHKLQSILMWVISPATSKISGKRMGFDMI